MASSPFQNQSDLKCRPSPSSNRSNRQPHQRNQHQGLITNLRRKRNKTRVRAKRKKRVQKKLVVQRLLLFGGFLSPINETFCRMFHFQNFLETHNFEKIQGKKLLKNVSQKFNIAERPYNLFDLHFSGDSGWLKRTDCDPAYGR